MLSDLISLFFGYLENLKKQQNNNKNKKQTQIFESDSRWGSKGRGTRRSSGKCV